MLISPFCPWCLREGWGRAAFNLQPPEEPEDELGTQSFQERESFQEPSFSPGPYFPKCDRWNFTFEVFVQIVGNIQNSPWELGIQIPLVGGEVIWVSRGQNKETWTGCRSTSPLAHAHQGTTGGDSELHEGFHTHSGQSCLSHGQLHVLGTRTSGKGTNSLRQHAYSRLPKFTSCTSAIMFNDS